MSKKSFCHFIPVIAPLIIKERKKKKQFQEKFAKHE